MGIDMETATIFITGFANEINRGALLLVSDTPMIPEGIKTEEMDRNVNKEFVDLHLDLGIEAMTKIENEGERTIPIKEIVKVKIIIAVHGPPTASFFPSPATH